MKSTYQMKTVSVKLFIIVIIDFKLKIDLKIRVTTFKDDCKGFHELNKDVQSKCTKRQLKVHNISTMY